MARTHPPTNYALSKSARSRGVTISMHPAPRADKLEWTSPDPVDTFPDTIEARRGVDGSRGPFRIAALVERKSRFTMLVNVAGKDTNSVGSALSKQARKLPDQLRRSLTRDRGRELAKHKEFSIETIVRVYFCDPRSPWQRGTNENMNRLLRHYFPECTDLSAYSQTELNKIAQRLNKRPRKTLGFSTPADVFDVSVALTG
jgi:IS30 family transposase